MIAAARVKQFLRSVLPGPHTWYLKVVLDCAYLGPSIRESSTLANLLSGDLLFLLLSRIHNLLLTFHVLEWCSLVCLR